MATLDEIIKGTSGLIAYWPLHYNRFDVSGNDLHLEEWSGDAKFEYEPVSPSDLGGYSNGTSAGDETGQGVLYVEQPMNTKCVEIWVMSNPAFVDGEVYRGAFGFNQLSGGTAGNDERIILSLAVYATNSGNARLYISGSAIPELETLEYFDTPRHVVFQYESSIDKTVLYLDGVVKSEYQGNVFDLMVEGRFFTPAMFNYYSGSIYNTHGRMFSSDCALYSTPLTLTQITERMNADSIGVSFQSVELLNAKWARELTREEANPQPETLQYLDVDFTDLKLVTKLGDYNSMFNQQGEQRKTGYYQSTVTVSDVPKPNTRVLCLTNDGRLLDETYSDANGVYRFDHLLMDDKYLFVAQYNNGNPKVAPEYLAAAADWQTPTAYGSD